MKTTRSKSARLHPRACFQLRVLEELVHQPRLTLRRLTYLLYRDDFDARLTRLKQWRLIQCAAGEASPRQRQEAHYYHRRKESLIYSLSGNVTRAITLLMKKGLVEREDSFLSMPWGGENCCTPASFYVLTAAGKALLESRRNAEVASATVEPGH